MVVLGGWVFLMSEVPLHPLQERVAGADRELLYRNVERFRGGLVFNAHRRLYHSNLGLRVMRKRKNLLSNSEK